MAFQTNFIHLITQCLSSISYYILLTRSKFGLVSPSRGLSQRNHISLHLFIISVEALLRMMAKVDENQVVHGIKLSRNLMSINQSFVLCKCFFTI